MRSGAKEPDKQHSRTHQSFLQGALILTAGIMAVKVIGAMFKIPLTWIITEDGLGYFNTAYHFYSPIHSLATAGFPIAISRMVSECVAQKRYGDARRVHRVSIPIFITAGLCGTLIMLAGAPFYVQAIGNPEALPSMLALSPAILFGCLMAIYRGYYEGLRNMVPTAVSEILEAVCKLVIGLTGALGVVWLGMREYHEKGTVFGEPMASESYAKSAVLPYASAMAIVGVTIGSLVGFLYLFWKSKHAGYGITAWELLQSPPTVSRSQTVRRLTRTAIPIGLGALAVNIAGLVDTTFLQTRIGQLMEENGALLLSQYQGMIPEINQIENTVPNFLYGCYSQALTLFMVVPSVTQAFGISALPSVTSAFAKKDQKALRSSVSSVLRITCLFCIPAGLGLSILAYPIAQMVFGARASMTITARVLSILGIASIFAALSTPINSMLQAVGRVDLPVKLFLIGLTMKVTLNYFLSGVPEINIQGAAIGTLCCYLFLTVVGLMLLLRVTGIKIPLFSIAGKPVIGAVLCCAGAYVCQSVLSQWLPIGIAAGAALVIAVIIYIFALWLLCAFTKTDFLMLPKGKKMIKALEKIHFFG
ncbi:MAG: polysaccharide biosynthesis protein [Oscillospiraceae bacterium]|nr:polysaccharide biosynthesis protein [Oscillospiraceae bacterium]